jgi:16S rRNA (uracil1498-N3)-methyltransferase
MAKPDAALMSPRIFLAHAFAPGQALTLPPPESRHLQVLRLQPGAAVALFNGDDGLEWQAEVTRIGRAEVELRVGVAARVERELPVAVTLALGIPANERMDALVEKATELGAAAIQPLICERSVVRLVGDRAEARRRHWGAVAASASEQCGRVRVPRVTAPTKLDAWLRGLEREGEASGRQANRFVLSLDARATPPAALPAPVFDTSAPGLVVLSGPEGGLAASEEAAAVAAGFVRLGLGRRVLRADTAPVAFLAWLGLAVFSDRR